MEIEKNENKGKYKIINIILIIFIIIISFILYSRYVGIKGLIVREYKIESEKIPESFNGLKIVHFSDLLYGSTTDMDTVKNLVDKINELKPDIVVYTGNLISNIKEEDKALLKKELDRIEATNSKYAVYGNENENIYKLIMEGAHFEILDNEGKFIFNKSKAPIFIAGLSSSKSKVINYDKAFETINNDKNKDSYFKLVLLNKSDMTTKVIDKDNTIDLILSGNSLNGSIRLPFIGGIHKIDGSNKYIDPYYKINNTRLYISGGIGTNNFNYRFNNRPSINLYRLKSL